MCKGRLGDIFVVVKKMKRKYERNFYLQSQFVYTREYEIYSVVSASDDKNQFEYYTIMIEYSSNMNLFMLITIRILITFIYAFQKRFYDRDAGLGREERMHASTHKN